MENKECVHLWVRRRDGSQCAICGEVRFGVDLSELEREKLRVLRDDAGEHDGE